MTNIKLAVLFLKIGLAFAFLYASISSLMDPFSWIGFLPDWAKIILPKETILTVFSIFEIILAFWILSSWKLFYSSIISAAIIAIIVLSNIGAMDILFRDIPIVLIAISLAILSGKNFTS